MKIINSKSFPSCFPFLSFPILFPFFLFLFPVSSRCALLQSSLPSQSIFFLLFPHHHLSFFSCFIFPFLIQYRPSVFPPLVSLFAFLYYLCFIPVPPRFLFPLPSLPLPLVHSSFSTSGSPHKFCCTYFPFSFYSFSCVSLTFFSESFHCL